MSHTVMSSAFKAWSELVSSRPGNDPKRSQFVRIITLFLPHRSPAFAHRRCKSSFLTRFTFLALFMFLAGLSIHWIATGILTKMPFIMREVGLMISGTDRFSKAQEIRSAGFKDSDFALA